MAYKSFNQRFPKFKWVLMFAVILALPLTVWSVNNVSTNTQQHAYIPPGDGGNSSIMRAPTGLKTTVIKCTIDSSGKKIYAFSYNWQSVPTANEYQVVTSQKDSKGKVIIQTANLSGTGLSHGPIRNPPIVSLSWKVRGYDSYSKSYGPYSELKYAPFVCNINPTSF